MTILLHPNKLNPERYRVWDKELKVQRYFPLTKAGRVEAEKCNDRVSERKRARRLSRELDMNRLFDDKGCIRGLRRLYRVRPGRKSYECLKVCIRTDKNKSEYRELSLEIRSFDKAFELCMNWLIEKHDISLSRDLKVMFSQAKKYYENSARPQGLA